MTPTIRSKICKAGCTNLTSTSVTQKASSSRRMVIELLRLKRNTQSSWIWGSNIRARGQLTALVSGRTPHLRINVVVSCMLVCHFFSFLHPSSSSSKSTRTAYSRRFRHRHPTNLVACRLTTNPCHEEEKQSLASRAIIRSQYRTPARRSAGWTRGRAGEWPVAVGRAGGAAD
jgi:hypothetical protein